LIASSFASTTLRRLSAACERSATLTPIEATERELQRGGVNFQFADGVLLIPPAASHGLALELVEQGRI
jgi:hypothetical protein